MALFRLCIPPPQHPERREEIRWEATLGIVGKLMDEIE
jgi:hypothetical protein